MVYAPSFAVLAGEGRALVFFWGKLSQEEAGLCGFFPVLLLKYMI